MKQLISLTLALTLFLYGASALANEIALATHAVVCDDTIPRDKAALITVSKADRLVILDVTAELNCAHMPGNPELRVWRSAATVVLPTESPSGAAAMCFCTHQMSFHITDLYEGVKTIYYVQNGTSLGHADAP